MISPESWGFSSIPQLANVGTVFACEVCYMGTTLAHTLAILVPTHAAPNIGTDVAYLWRTSCKTRANLWRRQSWHTCCNARIMPIVCKCWHGGGGWLVLTIVVAPYAQNRWKLGILPRVLTTVSHWLALRLWLVAQQWKNSLTFV